VSFVKILQPIVEYGESEPAVIEDYVKRSLDSPKLLKVHLDLCIIERVVDRPSSK
jgi:hypothetical protein